MSSEAEHGQGDEGVDVLEAEGDKGDEPDLGVDRLDGGVGEPVGDGVEDHVAELLDAAGELGERGDAAASGPAEPEVECFDGVVVGKLEDGAQALFQQVSAVELRVGRGDLGELGVLAFGEVLGVLPEGVAEPLDASRQGAGRPWRGVLVWCSASAFRLGSRGCAGIAPRLDPDLVERGGRPLDDVERVRAQDRVGDP